MKAHVLLVEYEPRYVDRVKKALTGAGHEIKVAADLDQAVASCAHFEPHVVILTSVLPRVKLEDAITQLRARAGLRNTPFLILMSGYRGSDPAADAAGYGAQDILERPFSAEALIQRVDRLLESAVSPASTQAIPQDMLEALRKKAGEGGGGSSLTSDDLFGDILSDVEDGGEEPERPKAPPKETPAAASISRKASFTSLRSRRSMVPSAITMHVSGDSNPEPGASNGISPTDSPIPTATVE